ncbi:NADH-dependent reduced ferredoxin:NADP+ oxidoreductase [Candidatus Sulfopaludibacter sp. SbA3]|nr:NADH-dependent reduced ferredoxin:NADP+ oxidoreductase [Candidatus Sulfopaludibacter sp. SbA3]
MFLITRREQFGPQTFLWDVQAPDVARAARPGHFVMARIDEHGERIPLTVADFNVDRGTVTVVIQAVGKTTHEMMTLRQGDTILDFIGPLGLPSHIQRLDGTVVLVGGGLGVAPIYPQLREYKMRGNRTISIIGFRTRDLIFWEEQFRQYCDELIVATDDGSYGRKGFVTHALADVLGREADVREVVAIGPIPMMKACSETTRPFGVSTVVSLNSIMVDGTGMCGSCRVTVGGKMKFACVDGADFDGHLVNFDELSLRQKRFEREEKAAMERFRSESAKLASLQMAPDSNGAPMSTCELPVPVTTVPGPRLPKNIKTIPPERAPMPHQPPEERAHNFKEVALGLDLEGALHEAERCLRCKKPRCIPGCPVGIDIPAFIAAIQEKDIKRSYQILKSTNALPAVCGRVCPQESQCEATCVVGAKFKPVAIGRLERFVADCAQGRGWEETTQVELAEPKRAAIIGSGPSGLACAGELARHGVKVTIFEALHVAGGVLKYGIPEFRLPDMIIDAEIDNLKKMGVEIRLDTIIGKLFTIPQLLSEMGYTAAFVGTGAGSPKFAEIPGEAFNGVFSANEFLTRVNLMRGYRQPIYDTPVGMGKRVAVVGAGNTAMDACRVSLRMGAESVTCVYRRSRRESPARVEELEHAIEEGIQFLWLTAPVEIVGDSSGWVTGMRCQKMELGEPDASGRRRPVPVAGSEFLLDVDTVIYALGTTANPIIAQTTPGLQNNKWGYIVIDESTGMTSIPGVFAGGDIVTGAATVILAMGAGKRAANGMLQYMGVLTPDAPKELAPAGSV